MNKKCSSLSHKKIKSKPIIPIIIYLRIIVRKMTKNNYKKMNCNFKMKNKLILLKKLIMLKKKLKLRAFRYKKLIKISKKKMLIKITK